METERLLDVSVEDMRNIFGKQDHHIRKLEEDLHVKIVDRNGAVRIMGEEAQAEKAYSILKQLAELSRRGNEIEEQNVDYAITMGMEEKESVLTEIDKDIICHIKWLEIFFPFIFPEGIILDTEGDFWYLDWEKALHCFDFFLNLLD